MRIITDIKESNEALKEYDGATVQLEMYSPSLRRFALKLSLKERHEVLFIVGVGCRYIKGPIDWKDCKLRITKDKDKITLETITRIEDLKTGFELVTIGGFSMASGFLEEFGSSFENFLTPEG